jgi:predicted dithiol-disulfide oxidoreductase (DUF899 family)
VAGHKIGTRDEWQAARDELAKLEAEHAERKEEIKRRRLELPWVRRHVPLLLAGTDRPPDCL